MPEPERENWKHVVRFLSAIDLQSFFAWREEQRKTEALLGSSPSRIEDAFGMKVPVCQSGQ
jgi:hypothetical protein